MTERDLDDAPEYEQCEAAWKTGHHAKIDHPLPASQLIAELKFLAGFMTEYGATSFGEALKDLEIYGLVGRDGEWRPRWRIWCTDTAEQDYRYAAHRVGLLVANGLTERSAIAREVLEADLPAATFSAAWTRLRDTYHEMHPNRVKAKRGRPRLRK